MDGIFTERRDLYHVLLDAQIIDARDAINEDCVQRQPNVANLGAAIVSLSSVANILGRIIGTQHERMAGAAGKVAEVGRP